MGGRVGGQAEKIGMLVPKKGGHLTFHGGLLPFERVRPLISLLLNVVRKIWQVFMCSKDLGQILLDFSVITLGGRLILVTPLTKMLTYCEKCGC